jgi:serine/threonine-protein kinase
VEQVRAETVEELESARHRIDERLASTIAALETIRLDLLRLHAGRGSTADLTAAIDAAMAVGDDVSMTIASRASADRITAGAE